ncbi:hypothetical protein C5B78_02320 [Aeromonas salmonicida]|uniref:hypothetical protein n=1 Tax=Aeromonas salmonicida TaxID=645 RepID=UPI000F798F3E|nr:hypothetical protein [Aeromonas salmonicida]RSM32528.1 hypothetical protein C5B78_02320 [Aeromonas salmonicida]
MVRLDGIISSIDPDIYLSNKSESLWKYLNKKTRIDKKLADTALIIRCEKTLLKTKTSDYLKKYADNDAFALKRQINYLEYLSQNVKRIIVSKPDEFTKIINETYIILKSEDLFKHNGAEIQQTNFGKLLLTDIFKYTQYRSSAFCRNLYIEMGFEEAVCPYCNNNKIGIIKKEARINGSSLMLFELDHFYPKSMYPFLALSLYNLIPSCHDCNATIKKEKDFTIETHTHPYHESFDDLYKFKVDLQSFQDHSTHNLCITKNAIKPHDKSAVDFELEARYQLHQSDINSLIQYFMKYRHLINSDRADMLYDFILGIGVTKEKKAILKKTRSKVLRDILLQMDIQNNLGLEL